MGVIRLAVCIGGVYTAFLAWAIAQERLATPFQATAASSSQYPSTPKDAISILQGDRFPSPLFLNYAQALASCLSALSYLIITSWSSGELGKKGWKRILGFNSLIDSWKGVSPSAGDTGGKRRESFPSTTPWPSATTSGRMSPPRGTASRRGSAALILEEKSGGVGLDFGQVGKVKEEKKEVIVPSTSTGEKIRTLPVLLAQVSTFQTIAGPIGFLALRHISFPTMVLGKSCKLIPVMLLNILLYRRKFSKHKYVVVALVTAGISIFMLLAPAKAGKSAGSDSLWGLSLLVFNLMVDGLTNATQDQIFAQYPHYTGQQMMFHMSLLAQLYLLPLIILPLPSSPISLASKLPLIPKLLTNSTLTPPSSLPNSGITLSQPAFLTSIQFLISHPTALAPLAAYALLGGIGQLFIFETIQHFGSLTLTMVTVTRKLFTMLLSVFVYKHHLTTGQWFGVGVVFAGIGVEAGAKRRGTTRRER